MSVSWALVVFAESTIQTSVMHMQYIEFTLELLLLYIRARNEKEEQTAKRTRVRSSLVPPDAVLVFLPLDSKTLFTCSPATRGWRLWGPSSNAPQSMTRIPTSDCFFFLPCDDYWALAWWCTSISRADDRQPRLGYLRITHVRLAGRYSLLF